MIFFLQQQQAKAGESLRESEGDGKPDNAAADNSDVVARIRHER